MSDEPKKNSFFDTLKDIFNPDLTKFGSSKKHTTLSEKVTKDTKTGIGSQQTNKTGPESSKKNFKGSNSPSKEAEKSNTIEVVSHRTSQAEQQPKEVENRGSRKATAEPAVKSQNAESSPPLKAPSQRNFKGYDKITPEANRKVSEDFDKLYAKLNLDVSKDYLKVMTNSDTKTQNTKGGTSPELSQKTMNSSNKLQGSRGPRQEYTTSTDRGTQPASIEFERLQARIKEEAQVDPLLAELGGPKFSQTKSKTTNYNTKSENSKGSTLLETSQNELSDRSSKSGSESKDASPKNNKKLNSALEGSIAQPESYLRQSLQKARDPAIRSQIAKDHPPKTPNSHFENNDSQKTMNSSDGLQKATGSVRTKILSREGKEAFNEIIAGLEKQSIPQSKQSVNATIAKPTKQGETRQPSKIRESVGSQISAEDISNMQKELNKKSASKFPEIGPPPSTEPSSQKSGSLRNMGGSSDNKEKGTRELEIEAAVKSIRDTLSQQNQRSNGGSNSGLPHDKNKEQARAR